MNDAPPPPSSGSPEPEPPRQHNHHKPVGSPEMVPAPPPGPGPPPAPVPAPEHQQHCGLHSGTGTGTTNNTGSTTGTTTGTTTGSTIADHIPTTSGGGGGDEPPVDWFEPLEDDDEGATQGGWGPPGPGRQHEAKEKEEEKEEEGVGVGGEGEGGECREGSVAEGSEKSGSVASDEKVFKKSCSPSGERARSKVELSAILGGVIDVAMFDFKTGEFHHGQPQPPRRKRVKIRERLLSECSYMDRDEDEYTPFPRPLGSSHRRIKKEPLSKEYPISASPKAGLTCARCGDVFVGTAYDRQRKKPCCPSCWLAKRKTHPSARTKKEHVEQSPPQPQPQPQLPPPATLDLQPLELGYMEPLGGYEAEYGFEEDVKDRVMEGSDTEPSVNQDLDDDADDLSNEEGDYDDEDNWPKKQQRRRRACGTCDACLSTRDCGTCDFCVDKPKFGGRNTKRQKCRLRQCARQAKLGPGRRKPRYTYSSKPLLGKRRKRQPIAGHGGDERKSPKNHTTTSQGGSVASAPASNSHASGGQKAEKTENATRLEDGGAPAITQVLSLADSQARRPVDMTTPLYKLLEELHNTILPFLWSAILATGPQLHIVQCSKKSHNADTVVLIEPDFGYRITVQRQPLLPTHPLYEKQPERLRRAAEVIALLLELENYTLCQGITMEDLPDRDGPIILERALTCDFLVEGTVDVCTACRALCAPS
ncbi:hypothetical protein CRUP_028560 [Coryphaenoides rupestris]|nr:hypothetical protein CRUP_028560 [Coryphaenoides rupestris]